MYALSIIFWSIWRRLFGGLLEMPRALIVAVGFFMATLQAYVAFGPTYWVFLSGALAMAFWTPGHDFRNNSALWKRYFVIGIPWMIMEKYEGKRLFGIGWTETAELGAGALFGLTLELIFYILPLVYHGM